MYRKLGLEAELAPKSRMIVSERVGNVVARGEAAFGFQQMSELQPVKGITVVGPIPEEAQSITMFSGGIAVNAKEKAATQDLLAFLQSPEGAKAMKDSGLDPVAAR
jgi:molybdate transport system substrate-binding protein